MASEVERDREIVARMLESLGYSTAADIIRARYGGIVEIPRDTRAEDNEVGRYLREQFPELFHVERPAILIVRHASRGLFP